MMNKQASQFQFSNDFIRKYGPAAAGAAGGAALGGMTGGWGAALGAGALAGGLGLAYGMTPGKDLSEKLTHLQGYWNAFRNGGFEGVAGHWANNNPQTVQNIASNWAAANPDRVKQMAGDWLAANPEKAKQMAFDYMKNNPELRKQFTGQIGQAVRDASVNQGGFSGRLAKWFGPSATDITKQVDDRAVKMINKGATPAPAPAAPAQPVKKAAYNPMQHTIYSPGGWLSQYRSAPSYQSQQGVSAMQTGGFNPNQPGYKLPQMTQPAQQQPQQQAPKQPAQQPQMPQLPKPSLKDTQIGIYNPQKPAFGAPAWGINSNKGILGALFRHQQPSGRTMSGLFGGKLPVEAMYT